MIAWVAIIGFIVVGGIVWWLTRDAQYECYMGFCAPPPRRRGYRSY